MSQRTNRLAFFSCALLAFPLAALLGCGKGPPTPPKPADVKPYLEGELKGFLVVESITSGRPAPYAMPPDPPSFSSIDPLLDHPIPPPKTLRDFGVTVAAELVDVSLGEPVVGKDGTSWTIPFEAIQSVGEDLYARASVQDASSALGWKDDRYRKAKTDSMRLYPSEKTAALIGKGMAAERSRQWAMELKYPKGTRFTLKGSLTARWNDGTYSMMLVSAAPKDSAHVATTPGSRIPPEIVKFDRQKPTEAAAEWARPFNEFVAMLDDSKKADLEPERRQLEEVIAVNEAFAGILENVKDEATARVAVAELEKLAPRAGAIQRTRLSPLQAPSQFAREVRDQMKDRIAKSSDRAKSARDRVVADKALAKILNPALVRYSDVQNGRTPVRP